MGVLVAIIIVDVFCLMASMFFACLLAVRPDRRSRRMRVWRLLAPVVIVTSVLRIVADVFALQSNGGKPVELVVGLSFFLVILFATTVLGNTPISQADDATPSDNRD